MLLADGADIGARWRSKGQRRAGQHECERYVKELASLLVAVIQATRKMSEEEHLRMINMVSAMNTGGSGGGRNRFTV